MKRALQTLFTVATVLVAFAIGVVAGVVGMVRTDPGCPVAPPAKWERSI